MDYIYLDELYPNQNLEYGSATLGIPANEGLLDKIGDFFNSFINKFESINEKYENKFKNMSKEEFEKRVKNINMKTIPLEQAKKLIDQYYDKLNEAAKKVQKKVDESKWYDKNKYNDKELNKTYFNKLLKELEFVDPKSISKEGTLFSLGYTSPDKCFSLLKLNFTQMRKINKAMKRLEMTTRAYRVVIIRQSELYGLMEVIKIFLKEYYSYIIQVFQAIDDYKEEK